MLDKEHYAMVDLTDEQINLILNVDVVNMDCYNAVIEILQHAAKEKNMTVLKYAKCILEEFDDFIDRKRNDFLVEEFS